jgi:hypothetical protein
MRTTDVRNDYGKLAGYAGIVAAILVAIGVILTFAQGAPPALDDPADKVLKYYKDNKEMVKFGAALGFLALAAIPIWYLGLYSALRDRINTASDSWPRLGLVALIATGAVVAVQDSVLLALGLGSKDEFDKVPAVAGSLFDIYNGLAAAIAVLFGLLLIATGVALDRAGGYPKWWSTILYVGGVASFISFLAPFLKADALAYAALVTIIAFIAFVAVTSMAMLRSNTTGPTSPSLEVPR